MSKAGDVRGRAASVLGDTDNFINVEGVSGSTTAAQRAQRHQQQRSLITPFPTHPNPQADLCRSRRHQRSRTPRSRRLDRALPASGRARCDDHRRLGTEAAAAAIAEDVNILGPDEPTDRVECLLEASSSSCPSRSRTALLKTSNLVFCRAEPQDKQRLLKQLQRVGRGGGDDG